MIARLWFGLGAVARRLQAQASAKCRADRAVVISLETIDGEPVEEASSLRSSSFIYRVGETVTPHDYDADPSIECSAGIHFFTNRSEAEEWTG